MNKILWFAVLLSTVMGIASAGDIQVLRNPVEKANVQLLVGQGYVPIILTDSGVEKILLMVQGYNTLMVSSALQVTQ